MNRVISLPSVRLTALPPLLLLGFLSSLLTSPPIYAWQFQFDGGSQKTDAAEALAVDSNGDVLVSGVTTSSYQIDYLVFKLSGRTGSELWRRVFDEPSEPFEFHTLSLDSRSDVILAGAALNGPFQGRTFTIVKLSGSSGDTLWRKELPFEAGSPSAATIATIDGNSDIIATGLFFDASSLCKNKYIILKLSGLDGRVIWRYALPVERICLANPLTLDVDENGDVLSLANIWEGTVIHLTAIKISGSTGHEVSRRVLPTPPGFGALAVSMAKGDHNIVVAGLVNLYLPPIVTHGLVIKFSGLDGSEIWRKSFGGEASNTYALATSVAVTSNGDVFTGGAVGYNGFLSRLAGEDG